MLHSGGSTILVYLKISRECFVLLLIMMNSQQGLTGRDRDIDEFIRQEKDKPGFKEMFKKIMEGGSSTKKVENFLGQNQLMAQNFNNPAGLPQDLYEARMRQYCLLYTSPSPRDRG